MSFSYDISVRVNQTLATVSSSLYQIGFCTAAASVVQAPSMQIALAGSGTAANNAVKAKCYTSDTASSYTVVASSPFGTNATATYVFLRENSGNPGAAVEIQDDSNFQTIFKIHASESAFFRHSNAGYSYLMAAAASTSATASLQVIVVGE